MDGFTMNRKFFCKELGALRVEDVAGLSFFFNIGLRWVDLLPNDRRRCAYVQSYINKLPFGIPPGVKAHPISALGSIISRLYETTRKSKSSVFAYKGGHYEKDLLASLHILALNLENNGCPKAGELITTMAWLETCGHHIVPESY